MRSGYKNVRNPAKAQWRHLHHRPTPWQVFVQNVKRAPRFATNTSTTTPYCFSLNLIKFVHGLVGLCKTHLNIIQTCTCEDSIVSNIWVTVLSSPSPSFTNGTWKTELAQPETFWRSLAPNDLDLPPVSMLSDAHEDFNVWLKRIKSMAPVASQRLSGQAPKNQVRWVSECPNHMWWPKLW